MAHVIKVVAAVLDTTQLTLYKEDGTTVILMQGDSRIQRIVDQVTPILTARGTAEVDLDGENHYETFEKKTNGLVKLFRVTKDALAKFFGASEEAQRHPKVIGKIPMDPNHPTMNVAETAQLDKLIADATNDLVQPAKMGVQAPVVPGDPGPATQVMAQVPSETSAKPPENPKMAAAVADIMKHAVPVTDPTFSPGQVAEDKDHALVAMVGNQVVGGVESLAPQIIRANGGSTIGMERFMARIAAVASKRSHSVQDLLKFMQRGDLPVAEDGCIVIYKVLKTYNGNDKELQGKIVDCHSGKVPQRVGSYVCMAEDMVDHDRRQECSNGLHVARRQYLSGFGGDVMVLAKVAPEDVIAVPQYDSNKMRVCGYHILFQLTSEDAALLRANRPMTENRDAAQKLHRALIGDHVGKLEEVRITGSMGGGVKITPLVNEATEKKALASTAIKPETDVAHAISEDNSAPQIDPKVVAGRVLAEQTGQAEQATQASAPVKESRVDTAKRLYGVFSDIDNTEMERKDAAQKLWDFKKAAKIGWEALGLSDAVRDELSVVLVPPTRPLGKATAVSGTKEAKPVGPVKVGKFKAAVKPKSKAKQVVKKTPVPKVTAVDKSKFKPAATKPAQPIGVPVKPVDNSVGKGPSERILALLGALGGTKDLSAQIKLAGEIYAIKKAAKKAWDKLGVSEADSNEVLRLIAIKG